MSERPTFSPFWHRVRAMRPRLRPHVQITRQLYRGRRWHVAHDPATNQFYRLNPVAHELVALLDGSRTVEEAWKRSLERHGDAAPTQQEVIQLIGQMYNTNLLAVDASPEVDQLLRRGRERVKRKVASQAIGIMYFRLRLFNPDRLVAWVEPILRILLNRWGFLAWAAWVGAAAVALLPHGDALARGFDDAVAPSNWGWMAAVFVLTKAWHELGHGVICKRFGGQVPEFGFMLLVLFPAPYVDASACWGFANKWRRIAVGAGGMLFELALAAAAAFVWLNTPPGQLVHQIAYNCMLTAGVSTVLFNANPLMRFDGYYILSDLLEVPNLMQRSMGMLKHLFLRYVYRVESAVPPAHDPGERAVLLVYGVLALAYRLFLFFTITLFVMGKMFSIGLILAVWTAAAWFILPTGKFVHWLATSPQLAEFRGRAVLTSLAMIAGAALLVGAVPVPDRRRGVGVVESLERSGVHFDVDGFVRAAHVRAGSFVRAGDPILTCESPEIESQLRAAYARRAEFEAVERRATASDAAEAQIARQNIDAVNDWIAQLERWRDQLVVRAPQDGVVVGADPALLVGGYGRKGQAVCEIVDPRRIQVAATMTQGEAGWLSDFSPDQYSVELRSLAAVHRVIPGENVRVVPAGQQVLPHAALGFAGGGTIQTEQDDRTGRLATSRQWIVYVTPAANASSGPESGDGGGARGGAGTGDAGPSLLPGERVSLRFSLPPRPLLGQWVDRLQKLVQGRVNL